MTRFNDRQLFLIDHTKYTPVPSACVKTVVEKKSVDEKSHRGEKVVDNIWWGRVSTALDLKEMGFIFINIMVCLQQNESHSLPKGNPDNNIHETDSTENTCMKNRFQPVYSHFPTDFSTDESELLYFHVKRVRYERITTELVVLRSLINTQTPTIYNLSMIS